MCDVAKSIVEGQNVEDLCANVWCYNKLDPTKQTVVCARENLTVYDKHTNRTSFPGSIKDNANNVIQLVSTQQ
jgi:hypothetical protein